MPVIKTISTQFYNEHQSWFYEWILKWNKYRFRVKICRNAYDNQSYVRGYALDPQTNSWNQIVDRPITSAHCKAAQYFNNQQTVMPFKKDADSVVEELQYIFSD